MDRFYAELEKSSGQHRFPSFLFHLIWNSAWLSPNYMSEEESKEGRNDSDCQNCPFHDESLLGNLSWYSGDMLIMYELEATLIPPGYLPRNVTWDTAIRLIA